MQKCKKCGYQNLSSDTNCKKCSESLNATPTNTIPPTNPVPSNIEKKLGKKLYVIIGLIGITMISTGISPAIFPLMILVSVTAIGYILFKHNEDNKKRKLIAAFKFFKISDFDVMDGVEFENTLKAVFEGLDYRVSTTKASGDYGVDLILEQGGITIGVQAKRYGSKVSLKAVQEIASGIQHRQLSEGWVVTNNYFTNPAIKLAHSTNVRLVDRDGLIRCVKDAYQNMQKKLQP